MKKIFLMLILVNFCCNQSQASIENLSDALQTLKKQLLVLVKTLKGDETKKSIVEEKDYDALFEKIGDGLKAVTDFLETYDEAAQRKLVDGYSSLGGSLTPMVYEAVREPHYAEDIAKHFLEKGANPNALVKGSGDYAGETALFTACRDSQLKPLTIQLLLKHGANPNISKKGKKPLDLIKARHGKGEDATAIIKMLKEAGGEESTSEVKTPEEKKPIEKKPVETKTETPATSPEDTKKLEFFKTNMPDIVTRFITEITETPKPNPFSELGLSKLFPHLMSEKDAAQKINSFIKHFAENTAQFHIEGNFDPSGKTKFKAGEFFYLYSVKNPVLSSCACPDFSLAERLLITLKQVNDIVAYCPDTTKQIVHTSLAAGYRDGDRSKLLQLFMLIKCLLDFGYENILVKTIDPGRGNMWSPGDMIGYDFFKTAISSILTPIDVFCDIGWSWDKPPSSKASIKSYTVRTKATHPLVVVLSYGNTKACIEQTAKGAPLCHSFDIIDSTRYIDKQGREDFIQCIQQTGIDNNVIIYEGYEHKITAYKRTNLTEFMIKES